jgi:hypothetical protein
MLHTYYIYCQISLVKLHQKGEEEFALMGVKLELFLRYKMTIF